MKSPSNIYKHDRSIILKISEVSIHWKLFITFKSFITFHFLRGIEEDGEKRVEIENSK